MKQVREIIVVEGRYDKNVVAQIVDATIIETSGFRIFSDKEKIALLRRLAQERGLIILTDSDEAGFFIRGRLQGQIPNAKHAYIPGTKDGLEVEDMPPDVIIKALERAGATFCDDHNNQANSARAADQITNADFYSAKLSGNQSSAQRRRELAKRLDLPERLSSGGLLKVLNVLYTRDEFLRMTDVEYHVD